MEINNGLKKFISGLTIGVLFIIVSTLPCNAKTKKEQREPNVVFIVVDDLGWTDLKCFGSDFYQTPNVDNLADEGVKFTNAYAACTVCSPTRAALMSGKYPARINCTDWIEGWKFPRKKLKVPDWTMYLDTAEFTMAEAFKSAGYTTGHVGKWHLGEDSLYWPENQGFDVNIGGWAKGAPNRNKKLGSHGYFAPFGNPRLKDLEDDDYLTHRMANEACGFIKENKDKPFFLNLWFYNVHTPLQAKKAKVQKYKAVVDSAKHHFNCTYAAMVEHMDDAVGKVVQELKAAGIYDNTIIVFTSDNGGLVGRRNQVTNNYPLRNGKGHMYEGGVRVPAIIVAPDFNSKEKICDKPIISMDFYPTLMELAGIHVDKQVKKQWDGKSLVPLLSGRKTIKREALFWHYPHYHIEGAKPYSAVRHGDWKLIRFFENDKYALYNLASDVSESKNLIKENPRKAEELKENLFEWYEEVGAQMPTKNPNFKKK